MVERTQRRRTYFAHIGAHDDRSIEERSRESMMLRSATVSKNVASSMKAYWGCVSFASSLHQSTVGVSFSEEQVWLNGEGIDWIPRLTRRIFSPFLFFSSGIARRFCDSFSRALVSFLLLELFSSRQQGRSRSMCSITDDSSDSGQVLPDYVSSSEQSRAHSLQRKSGTVKTFIRCVVSPRV